MIQPKLLQAGDTVAIVSPAKFIPQDSLLSAVQILQSWGLQVRIGLSVYQRHFQMAGTDAQRLADLQEAMDDPKVKAIFCSRGGYGSGRLLDALQTKYLLANPKWLIGFSDITFLHAFWHAHKVMSIHATMPLLMNPTAPEATIQGLKEVLFTGNANHQWANSASNRLGSAQGVLWGGNLSIISHLLGTPYQPDFENIILFIEEVSEYKYRIDRLMVHLKMAGVLARIKGLVVGQFTDTKDNPQVFGASVEEIIQEHCASYAFPIAFGFEAGHEALHLPLVFGKSCNLEVSSTQSSLKYESSR
ncbi:LD-carboxypeptidase [Cytophagales bacterium LB-30]|uniref:LD-carboxypeptidase n=1 Tax=Shiella aurantiaca TaxID=3058365 RepID=A0ABT8F2B7_9BACT|nr:LD-carboxypeptidase [Shiella aurantiaca]MDN4164595.1 LD-carboxypeptidase [Shiella aurantiaca]